MPYIIKDENGESMRVVKRKEEAIEVIKLRPGWTMFYLPAHKESLEERLKKFERAPF
jgi:hypothetical protein